MYDAHGVASSPVVTRDELIAGFEIAEHAQGGRYRRIPQPINFSATPATYRREAPPPGEHNHEIPTEAGYSTEEIAALAASGELIIGRLSPRQAFSVATDLIRDPAPANLVRGGTLLSSKRSATPDTPGGIV